MPTLDSDHNHYTLGRHGQSSQSSGYGSSTQLVDDPLNPIPASSQIDQSLPTLPAYTYTLPTNKRPVVSTTFKEHASNHNINGYTHHLPREDDSPDPHDFYRRYQDSFADGASPSLGQADIIVTKPEDSMVAPRHQRRLSPISARANGTKAPPPSTRGQPAQGSRRPSAPSVDHSPLANAKSNPALSSTARNRQTLKDLVHRFNQTPDEVPPLPRKSTSRATSFNSNQATGLNHAKGRTLSQSKSSGLVGTSKGSFSSQEQSGKSARLHQRRGRNSEDVSISPILTNSAIGLRSNRPDSNPYASQSMTDLNPDPARSVRKPLFGEVSAFSVDQGNLGYGIPGSRRRRGSEGSMHSPNPMFPIERQSRRVSPSSPSAWYLGVTPTLEEIKLEKTIPSLPPSMHRRTRSDFAGAFHRPLSPNISTRPASTTLYPIQPLPPSPTSARTFKRDSQSRIPVSSRRLSLNSDSSNSAPSTRNNSAMGRNSGFVLPPKKGTTALPKPSQKSRSPTRNTRQQSSRNSPRRSDFNQSQRPATSPRLAAYISAPMPKKSPPLRSSRPRQPVSSASTSASRARAVDRLSGHESSGTKASREPRSKRPPELGVVDFAARRQKIHEAFTKTVRENERQEIEAEKRRISMALQSQPQVEENIVQTETLQIPENKAQHNEDSPLENHGEIEPVFETPAENSSKLDEKFDEESNINISHLAERSVLDLEDSPTLGDFNQFSSNCVNDGMVTPPSDDAEPSSAVTASTSDTVETFFDNEPQEEPQSSYHEHPSLLNSSHVLGREDSSPTSITEVQPPAVEDDCTSEKDDRESIQIMLSDTPVVERAKFNESFENKSRESASNEEPNSRWSTASWESSTKSKDGISLDPDTPMERIDENSPSIPADSAHLSISTTTTDQTPQAWSPATASSPRTVRTTMESDTYSIINRVLDYYHDPNLVSPELMNDFQQHVITQSPELARLGGWDPKKVTQIYLQKLAQDRCTQPNRPTARDSGVSRQSMSSLDDRPEALPEALPEVVSSSFGEQDHGLQEHLGENVSPPQDSLTVDDSDYNPHRASLSAPADWADMSPSMNYWMTRQAEAADSPLEEKPNLLRKGWKNGQEGDGREGLPQELPSDEFRPQLPPIKSAGQGLGIKLVVMSPQDDDSPTIPPPLPDHTPPPPPEEPPDLDTPPQAQMPSPPSPGFYGQHNASRAHPKHFQIEEANNPVLGSADIPQRSLTSTPSAQQPSLQNSQARQSTGGNSVLSEASAQLPGPPTPDQKRLTKRRHIIKELVDTEHSFGQDMKVVDDIYRGTSNVIIISAEDVKTLFGNSGEIVAFSTNFLDALKQSAKAVYVLPKSKRWRSNRTSNATSYSGNTDDQSSVSGAELNDDERDRKTFIGEAFANHMLQMEKVYSEYLKNHDAANQKLQALQKNQKVQIWLKECRAYAHDLTTAWDLDSLLVKPVQRILKYPLLLDQLLEVTPVNHPDYTALDVAAREMKGISMRINEMKRRADLMDQVANRKRNQSDVRGAGVIKKFGRRTTEKLIQQVGLSDTVEDKVYASVAEKFGSHFFQLQVVMRDVEMYTKDVGDFMERFNSIASAMEEHIDVSQTSYPELESKWRKFKMSIREIQNTALPDHIQAVRKNVIDPMTTCLKLHDGPQKMMQKRSKRLLEYNRYKALKDRGEKPDKKTVEHGEQFMAINETLKEELPKLFALTKKLVEACLINFVQLQLQWHAIWRRKLSQAIDESKDSTTLANIIEAFVGDFRFFEGQLLSLGICNGSVLADAINPVGYLSPTTTLTGDGTASPRQTTSLDLTKSRTLSVNNDVSPMLPQPDFGIRGNANFFGVDNGLQLGSGSYSTVNSTESNRRMRASSAVSCQSPHTPEIPGAYRSYSNSNTPVSNPVRPTTAITRTTTDPIPSLPRQSLDTSNVYRPGDDATIVGRRSSGSTNALTQIAQQAPSPSGRFSGFFSSAMPMSDSPPAESPVDNCDVQKEFHVIFLAASIYPFNIDRARREAGYPYLTYVAGEIFDIIGEKGELWLAKNQDDTTNQIGWIWNKHFIKLGT